MRSEDRRRRTKRSKSPGNLIKQERRFNFNRIDDNGAKQDTRVGKTNKQETVCKWSSFIHHNRHKIRVVT